MILKIHRKLEDQYDLVIIGGGLSGLTAAFESNLRSILKNSLNWAITGNRWQFK